MELASQDEDEVAAVFHGWFRSRRAPRARRHGSEQYLTFSQFFAQDFRQVITRPHAAQRLLGRYDLLPLNSIAMG
jgi:hypothetical protein